MEYINHYVETYASGLSKELTDVLENIPSVKKFAKDGVIYYQGEVAQNFFYLKKGKVRIYMTSENGMEKTLNTVSRGAIFGEAAFFDGKPRVSSAKALVRCEIVPITTRVLEDTFRQHPETAIELLRFQAQTIRMLSSQVDSITFLSAESRIARFLLDSAEEKDGKSYVFSTHEEIGNSVGTSRVTVSRIINNFSRLGYIETGYGKLILHDKNALAAIK